MAIIRCHPRHCVARPMRRRKLEDVIIGFEVVCAFVPGGS